MVRGICNGRGMDWGCTGWTGWTGWTGDGLDGLGGLGGLWTGWTGWTGWVCRGDYVLDSLPAWYTDKPSPVEPLRSKPLVRTCVIFPWSFG